MTKNTYIKICKTINCHSNGNYHILYNKKTKIKWNGLSFLHTSFIPQIVQIILFQRDFKLGQEINYICNFSLFTLEAFLGLQNAFISNVMLFGVLFQTKTNAIFCSALVFVSPTVVSIHDYKVVSQACQF